MQWGICVELESDFERSLWSLPPPSTTREVSSMNGITMQIIYFFEYPPQSWREWQRVSSIKIQMKEQLLHIRFAEFQNNNSVNKVYTISELGKYFPKFIKFNKPLYPQNKDEFMRSLTIYAQRLHYEKQLHLESLLAMSIHFNASIGELYKFRELYGKVRAILNLDMSDWKQKLSEAELKEAYNVRNKQIAQQKKDKSQPIRDKAKSMRANGETFKSISKELSISVRTVQRYVS